MRARPWSALPTNSSRRIRHLQEITGGFGVVLGFAHDWANREATLRSWDLLARYVIPEINGSTTVDPRIAGVPARQPGRADGRERRRPSCRKILAHEGAAAALATTMAQAAQAAADKDAPKQSEFRPGAGVPTAPTDRGTQ